MISLTLLLITNHLLGILNSFGLFACQILADKMIKNVQHFRVKWVAISYQGSTWEPRKHLIGENVEQLLNAYTAKKQAQAAAEKKRKADMLASILVETDNPKVVDLSDDNPQKISKSRVNSPPFTHHFFSWY